jgi:low temperature requirement protein LtrA
VPYRALVLVQMAGVLIIAAGVPSSFSSQDFTAIIVGYVVMRVGLVALWIRAGVQHPAGRATAFRYAAGIAVVQALWIGRLALPDQGPWWLFPVLAGLDLAVPIWASRTGETAWHPHHMAERYGLFTIILLGESVLAATTGVQGALAGGGLSGDLIVISIAGLVLLFVLWWLYFSEPAGEGLANHRELSYVWGYGHFGIFASLAAIGAGLEVAVETAGHLVISPAATVLTAALVLLIPLAAETIGLAAALVGIAVVLIALLAHTLLGTARHGVA